MKQHISEKLIICSDINECDENKCGVNSHCTNTDGDYTCKCKDGFIDSGDEKFEANCKDANECELMTHNCEDQVNTHCENNTGSYECACNKGYSIKDNGKCGDDDDVKPMNMIVVVIPSVKTFQDHSYVLAKKDSRVPEEILKILKLMNALMVLHAIILMNVQKVSDVPLAEHVMKIMKTVKTIPVVTIVHVKMVMYVKMMANVMTFTNVMVITNVVMEPTVLTRFHLNPMTGLHISVNV